MLLLVIAVALVCGAPAWAQAPEGRISGVVRDATGAGIPGVTVTNQATNASQTTTTAHDGSYVLSLAPGTYSVTASMDQVANATAPRDEQPPRLPKGADEWTALAGGADAVSINGSRAGRQFLMLTLNWGRILSAPAGPGLLRGQVEVLLEVVPVFVMFQSQRAFGYGVTPVFFRWSFATAARLQPFAEIAGGLLRTDQEVPEGAKRRNFTAQAGLGVRLWLDQRRALLLGYRFHHISNAGPGKINPGVNANFFYAGLSVLR